MGRLAGRIAIVTGADSGIGQAIAMAYAHEGADVAVAYRRDRAGAARTCAAVERAGARALAVRADVRRAGDVAALFAACDAGLGVASVLVNNAGIAGAYGPATELSPRQWDDVIRTNLSGPFYCAREFARRRRDAGGGGKLINVTSVYEQISAPWLAAYNASKAGLGSLTRTLALELAPLRINVVAIGPGMVLTPMNQHAIDDPAQLRRDVEGIPWNRAAEPAEIARLAVYLASDDADYVTGQTIFIDGGMMLAGPQLPWRRDHAAASGPRLAPPASRAGIRRLARTALRTLRAYPLGLSA